MHVDLSGTSAMVSGSTSGIGKTVALSMAEAGADVVVHGRSEERGRRVVEQAEDQGARAHFVGANMTEYAEVEQAVETAADELGGIDILVCSGGVGAGPPVDFFADMPAEDIAQINEVQYESRLYFVKAALPHLKASDDSRVISITSDAGRIPTPGEVCAGGAAAGVMMTTRTLANELSRWEITVNAVALSVVQDTDLLEEFVEDSPISSIMEKAVEKQVFETTSDDVAELVVFLAGAEGARPITGQTISVTGGVSF